MKQDTLKLHDITGLDKKSLLGDADHLTQKIEDFDLVDLEFKVKIFACLDLLDDKLVLRLFRLKDNKLIDHSITSFLSADDKNAYLYKDGSWKMVEQDAVARDLEEHHQGYQIIKLNNLNNLELNAILKHIIQKNSSENILNNLDASVTDYGFRRHLVLGFFTIGSYHELLHAYKEFFGLHLKLKNDELAKEYFSFGFKTKYQDYENFKHQLEKHCKVKINEKMTLKDIVPYDIDYKAIVLSLKNIYGEHYFAYKAPELFLTAILNHYHILSMFNEPMRVLEYIQTNVREFSKDTFSINHFKLYIYNPDSHDQLLKDYVLLGLNEHTHDILLASLLERIIYVSKKTYSNYNDLFELYGKYHNKLKLHNNLDERFKSLDRHSIFDIIMPVNIYEEYNKFNYIK